MFMTVPFIDLTGQVFGELTVVSHDDSKTRGAHQWLCACLCGSTLTLTASDLIGGSRKTCGGHKSAKQLAWEGQQSINLRKNPVGFDGKSRLYRIWGNMKSRCLNKNFPKYKDYGARGIGICEEWMTFVGFRAWSLDNGYSDLLTLDRMDNYKGYEPGNCWWVTPAVQQRNKRKPRVSLTAYGETKTAMDWAKDPRCTVSYRAVMARVARGETGSCVLTTPVPVGRPPGGISTWNSQHA